MRSHIESGHFFILNFGTKLKFNNSGNLHLFTLFHYYSGFSDPVRNCDIAYLYVHIIKRGSEMGTRPVIEFVLRHCTLLSRDLSYYIFKIAA